MLKVVAAVFVLLAAAPVAAQQPALVALSRTDTTLTVQWDMQGYTHFTVDYLGPEWFEGGQPTCDQFPMHPSIHLVEGGAAVLTGLQPLTPYHIHVHPVDPITGMLIEGASSTNVIIVSTRADATPEPLTPESPDYISCGGGGGGGGGEESCAQVTFTLLPGSAPFEEVEVALSDPFTGEELGSFTAVIGEPVPAPAGSFHLRFTQPAGYRVTPPQRDLDVSCGEDSVVRLRFRLEPPRRK